MELYLVIVLFLSLIANTYLGYLHFSKKPALTKDAKELLTELMSGSAVIKLEVLDAAGLFYRSPRG